MKIFRDANLNEYVLPEGEQIHWRISAYSLVLSDEDKLLVNVPTWNTLYELPGGGVEPHETTIEGMIRECYEETGYRIEPLQTTPFYVAENNFYHRTKKMFCRGVLLFYPAKLISTIQDTYAINSSENPNEIARVEWVPLAGLDEKNCHPVEFPAIKLLQSIT